MVSRNRAFVVLLAISGALLFVFVFKNKSTSSNSDVNLFSMLCRRDIDDRIVLRRIIANGEVYVVAICPADTSMTSLPSGSEVYIYNSSGHLIDFTGDVGDNPKFAVKWIGFSSGEPINKHNLVQLIQECNSRIISRELKSGSVTTHEPTVVTTHEPTNTGTFDANPK